MKVCAQSLNIQTKAGSGSWISFSILEVELTCFLSRKVKGFCVWVGSFFCSQTEFNVHLIDIWGRFHKQIYAKLLCSSQKRKNSIKLSVSFYAFGIYVHKSCAYNVDEIDTWRLSEDCLNDERIMLDSFLP
jgi:hypothetical protein